jgi:RimJ/RimL family protein N-acetyltransferase
MIEFTSDRLEFRTWSGEEEESLLSIMTDTRMPEFWKERWGADGYTHKIVSMQQSVHERFGVCAWALWEKADDLLIGFCGLVPMPGTEETEVWWGLGFDHWGKGLATEAALRVVAYANQIGRTHLVALTQPHNERSMRLAERIGMRNEGEVQGYGNTGIRYAMSLETVDPIGQ